MTNELLYILILFTVIFDPLASYIVFFVATKDMSASEKKKTAFLAVLVATLISVVFIIFGQNVLSLFNTSINDFRVASGIILLLLGVKMALGQSLASKDMENNSSRAIAAVIATPLLTGPAAITAIIITVNDYGMALTSIAIAVVMVLTLLLLLFANKVQKVMGKTTVQVISTILGLITLSWSIKFIRLGLGI